MECAEAREEFSALLDGELTPEVRASVEAHLAQCSDCLRELDQIKHIDRLYRGLAPQSAPANFEERVRETVHARGIPSSPRRFRRVRLWPVLAAAAVLLVVLGGALLQRQMRSERFEMAASVRKAEYAEQGVPQAAPSVPESARDQLQALGYGAGGGPAAPAPAPKPATAARREPLSAKQEMPLAFAPSKPAQPPQEVEETAVPQASPEATREKVHVSAAARPAPTAQPKLLAQEAPPPTTEKVREDALEFFAPRPSSAPTAPEKPAEAEGAYRQAAEIPEEIGSQALRHADAVPGEATPPLPVASGAKRAGMPSKTEVGGPTHESALSLGRSAAKETEKPRGPANTARQLVDEGEAFMNQGKTDAAVKSYRDGLRLEPSSVDIRTRLGLALSKQGKSKEAVRYFAEAIRIDPKNVAAHLYLGDEYAKTGQLDKAIAHYNQVLEIDPANKYALLNLGSALETLGRHEEAMDRLKNALAIDRAFTAAQELLDRIIAEHGTGAPSADQGPH